jgi:phage terminase large subunit-like protein
MPVSKEVKSNIQIDLDRAAAVRILRPGGFYFFVQEFWDVIIPEEPVWNWHIKEQCDIAEDIIWRLKRREVKLEDLIVNVPPGSSKSTIWSQMLPSFAWAIDYTLRILLLSYSDGASMTNSMKCRDIIQSDKYRRYFPHVAIRKDSNSKTEIHNTKNGQVYATGISGSITGKHFHLLVIDDPLNPKEAASELECTNASTLIDSTVNTRKVNKAIAVTALIMQRLSELDPTAHLLGKKDKKIKHIRLPAEVIDGPLPASLAKKYVDGLLDPVRMGRAVLDEALTDMGAANYAGQFSQQPVPAGGLIWKKWFIEVPDENWPDARHMTQYGTDWDTAYTKDDDNAASAFITAGKIGNKIYLDNIGWAWLEFPQLIRYMKQQPLPHYIEAKASGKSAKSTLVANGVPAIEINVKGGSDKIARAKMSTPVAESGMVYIRKSLADKLYNDPRQGILKFPRGKFKDLADVLAQCLQRLGKKGGVSSHSAASDREEDF